MKRIIIIQSVIVINLAFLSSCFLEPKTIELANGKMVSEKKFKKMTHKAFKVSFGKMSKEEENLLFNKTSIQVVIDTSIYQKDSVISK